jgi:uncharacterized membrane protein YbaN (DUF454 family)
MSVGPSVEFHERSGVVEIHDPRLFRPGREAFCRALAESAIDGLEARRVEICLTTSLCRLEFKPGEFDTVELGRRVAEAVKVATPAIRDQARAPQGARASATLRTARAKENRSSTGKRQKDHPGTVVRCNAPIPAKQPPQAPNGAPRVVHLALTGGSLTMAVAGVILPGIPSLPFLALAARHAVRLSPKLDRFLRSRTWSAAILRRALASGGLLRLDRRSLLKAFPIIALTAAILLVVHPPLPVVIALEVGVMAFACLQDLASARNRHVALVVPGEIWAGPCGKGLA